MRQPITLAIALTLTFILATIGCGKKSDAPPAEPPAPLAAESAPAPAGDEAPEDEAGAAEEQEQGEADPAPEEPSAGSETVTARARTVVNREMLAKAYEEIYCAQRKGQTDQILDIYKKYGFDTPKDWTEAWTQTADDPEWQEALTRRIQSSRCE
jgi:hypothetical protein